MVATFRTLGEADLSGKRVLVRVDFNVPLDGTRVRDDTRIRAAAATIRHLGGQGARVILMSHLGRPKGRRIEAYSLKHVAHAASSVLGTPVAFVDQCIGPEAEAAAAGLSPGDVLLLENLRFHEGEEANDDEFAASLASLADVYVNDAFGTAHRAHASTVGVAARLPAYAGKLMQRELEYLGSALDDPKRPFVMVLGGAKVSGKLEVIKHLLPRVDTVLVGGAMAFTFSLAQGGAVGESLVEPDLVAQATEILAEASERGVEFILPSDVVATRDLKGNGQHRVVPFGEVPAGWKGVDVGPKTIQAFGERIAAARTVLLNGPMGVFEVPAFLEGTRGVFGHVRHVDGTTIAGGGDTAAALAACGLTHDVTHVSTGGGASLEFLEGKTLPGVAALSGPLRTVR